MESRLDDVVAGPASPVCPPHHWLIEERRIDDVTREVWQCRRCDLVKLNETAVLAPHAPRDCSWNVEDFILRPDLAAGMSAEERLFEDAGLSQAGRASARKHIPSDPCENRLRPVA